ncbi:MAG: response regulator [Pseudorhodobacter sp.]|nr:response regulator [Pseudorhodobacter sp.]
MKILAVDDDPVFRDLLVSMLRALGKENVTTAASAAEALMLLNRGTQDFDCIFSDIQMPEMDGVAFCSVVRKLPAYQRTPIVMISAMATRKFIDDAFAAGATDYVTKPLDRLELKARLGMVERLLDERHRAESLTRQFEQRADVVTVEVDFETAFMIPGFDRAIEYLGLENYRKRDADPLLPFLI